MMALAWAAFSSMRALPCHCLRQNELPADAATVV